MLMKDGLGPDAAKRIVGSLECVLPSLNAKQCIDDLVAPIATLELKQRVAHFIKVIAQVLPDNFADGAELLVSLKSHWNYGDPEDPLRSFAAWPLVDYFATYGLSHPEQSLKALGQLTDLFSAEFAIRPFIQHHPEMTFSFIKQWQHDDNPHLRRLCSEGTRPRLPWGIKLAEFCHDPSPCLPILAALMSDPSEYVRRSVANHLNDIAKDNPAIVIEFCQQWQKNATQDQVWIIKHACRSLIKSGYPEVFSLLGYSENPKLKLDEIKLLKREIILGEALEFSLSIASEAKVSQKLAIDFVIYHVKANGDLSPKVFKLKECILAAGESISINKRHPIRPITTRKYYPGEHVLAIQINGIEQAKQAFSLAVT